jgi:hypothetical protein
MIQFDSKRLKVKHDGFKKEIRTHKESDPCPPWKAHNASQPHAIFLTLGASSNLTTTLNLKVVGLVPISHSIFYSIFINHYNPIQFIRIIFPFSLLYDDFDEENL